MTGVCKIKHTMEEVSKECLLALPVFGSCQITRMQRLAAGPSQRRKLVSQPFAPNKYEQPHVSVCSESIPDKWTLPHHS